MVSLRVCSFFPSASWVLLFDGVASVPAQTPLARSGQRPGPSSAHKTSARSLTQDSGFRSRKKLQGKEVARKKDPQLPSSSWSQLFAVGRNERKRQKAANERDAALAEQQDQSKLLITAPENDPSVLFEREFFRNTARFASETADDTSISRRAKRGSKLLNVIPGLDECQNAAATTLQKRAERSYMRKLKQELLEVLRAREHHWRQLASTPFGKFNEADARFLHARIKTAQLGLAAFKKNSIHELLVESTVVRGEDADGERINSGREPRKKNPYAGTPFSSSNKKNGISAQTTAQQLSEKSIEQEDRKSIEACVGALENHYGPDLTNGVFEFYGSLGRDAILKLLGPDNNIKNAVTAIGVGPATNSASASGSLSSKKKGFSSWHDEAQKKKNSFSADFFLPEEEPGHPPQSSISFKERISLLKAFPYLLYLQNAILLKSVAEPGGGAEKAALFVESELNANLDRLEPIHKIQKQSSRILPAVHDLLATNIRVELNALDFPRSLTSVRKVFVAALTHFRAVAKFDFFYAEPLRRAIVVHKLLQKNFVARTAALYEIQSAPRDVKQRHPHRSVSSHHHLKMTKELTKESPDINDSSEEVVEEKSSSSLQEVGKSTKGGKPPPPKKMSKAGKETIEEPAPSELVGPSELVSKKKILGVTVTRKLKSARDAEARESFERSQKSQRSVGLLQIERLLSITNRWCASYTEASNQLNTALRAVLAYNNENSGDVLANNNRKDLPALAKNLCALVVQSHEPDLRNAGDLGLGDSKSAVHSSSFAVAAERFYELFRNSPQRDFRNPPKEWALDRDFRRVVQSLDSSTQAQEKHFRNHVVGSMKMLKYALQSLKNLETFYKNNFLSACEHSKAAAVDLLLLKKKLVITKEPAAEKEHRGAVSLRRAVASADAACILSACFSSALETLKHTKTEKNTVSAVESLQHLFRAARIDEEDRERGALWAVVNKIVNEKWFQPEENTESNQSRENERKKWPLPGDVSNIPAKIFADFAKQLAMKQSGGGGMKLLTELLDAEAFREVSVSTPTLAPEQPSSSGILVIIGSANRKSASQSSVVDINGGGANIYEKTTGAKEGVEENYYTGQKSIKKWVSPSRRYFDAADMRMRTLVVLSAGAKLREVLRKFETVPRSLLLKSYALVVNGFRLDLDNNQWRVHAVRGDKKGNNIHVLGEKGKRATNNSKGFFQAPTATRELSSSKNSEKNSEKASPSGPKGGVGKIRTRNVEETPAAARAAGVEGTLSLDSPPEKNDQEEEAGKAAEVDGKEDKKMAKEPPEKILERWERFLTDAQR